MSKEPLDASVPGQFPTQDGVDRSDHIAIIFSLQLEWSPDQFDSIDWQRLNGLNPTYDKWVHESLQAWEIDGHLPTEKPIVDRQPYQVGPAAGGLFDTVEHIVTLYRLGSEIYGHITFGLFLIGVARNSRREAKNWVSSQAIEHLDVSQAYTPLVLKYMCSGYVMERFGHSPTGEPHILCLTSEFFDGISSPAHPTSMVEYEVSLPTEAGIYGFHIRGDSVIEELFLNTGNDTEVLSSPLRLDETWEHINEPNIPQ